MHIYGEFWDSTQGEEREGGQRRLSTPTSPVMEIIQYNMRIAIMCRETGESNGDGERERSRGF